MPFFRRSDRYIFGELLLPFFIGTFALIMMMVGTTLYNLLESLLREKWPIEVVLRVLALNIPAVLVLALPVATSLAVSLAVNRLARDNEITVLRGVGVPLWRVFLPVLLFGLLVSAADLYISDRVVPWASAEQMNLQSALDARPKNVIERGTTIRKDEYVVNFTSFVKLTDTRWRLNRVIIVEDPKQNANEYALIATAEYAEYERGLWTIKNAVVHRYNKDGITEWDAQVETAKMNLTIDFSMAFQNGRGDAMLLSYDELVRRADESKRMGQVLDARRYDVERWFKLSLPMMCAVFAFCAPPLAMRFSKGGSFTGILLSIILVFVAWNTLLLMKYFALGGILPPVVAAWSTNILFFLIGLLLLRTQE